MKTSKDKLTAEKNMSNAQNHRPDHTALVRSLFISCQHNKPCQHLRGCPGSRSAVVRRRPPAPRRVGSPGCTPSVAGRQSSAADFRAPDPAGCSLAAPRRTCPNRGRKVRLSEVKQNEKINIGLRSMERNFLTRFASN